MYQTIGSIFIFFIVPLLLGAFVLYRTKEIPALLVIICAAVIQQIIFITYAKLFDSYYICFPFAMLTTAGFGIAIIRSYADRFALNSKQFPGYQLIPLLLFAVVFIVYLAIRSYYPFIAFINNGDEVGVEKLYNLSLHQSFLFGRSWPTEWIWLHDEPIRYYVFLKSIPGIISWIARVVFSQTDTGGILFILSEAFFVALTPAVMSAWLLWFGRHKPVTFLVPWVIFIPLIGLLGYHFKGFWMGVSGLGAPNLVNWWLLADQVIPYTQSQYPVWLMLLGDNHAYSQVYFLQILLWGSVFQLVKLNSFRWQLSGLVGAIALAVLLSHPGSILINISTLLPFVLLCIFAKYKDKDFSALGSLLRNLLMAASVFIAGIAVLYVPAGKIKIVLPDSSLTSPLLGFLNQNFSIILFGVLVALFLGISIWRQLQSRIQSLPFYYLFSFLIVTILMFVWRPGIAVVFVAICVLNFLLSYKKDTSNKLETLFALTSILVLIPPEVIAFDHALDARVAWIRFQMSLRFWPESYMLIPFALGIAFCTPLAGELTRRKQRILFCIFSVFILTLIASHIPGIQNRLSRVNQTRTLDGFYEFYVRYPSDSAIIKFLRQLPDEQLVIAELCSAYGMPNIPEHFGWPGRIAAYSGRVGICGWGRHAVLYNNPLSAAGFKEASVEEKIMGFSRVYQRILARSVTDNPGLLDLDRKALRTYGITHLIFGEWEKKLFPNSNVSMLANFVNGTVVFSNEDGTGIINLNK